MAVPSFFVILVMVSSSGILPSYPKSEESTIPGFEIYDNSDYQIQIQYPKKWEKSEENLTSNVIVKCTAPDTKDISSPASLILAYFSISNDGSLDDFIKLYFTDILVLMIISWYIREIQHSQI